MPGQIVAPNEVLKAMGRSSAFEPGEVDRFQFWIDGAMALIRKRLGPLENLDQDNLKFVITSAVARCAANPEGYENFRIDDFSAKHGQGVTGAQITITDSEWDLLTPVRERTFGVIGVASHIGDRYGDYAQRGW